MKNHLPNYSKVVDLKRLDFIKKNIAKSGIEKPKVLDIGCGNGIISMQLGLAGFDVRGVDVSEKAIEQARKKCNLKNVKFEVVSAEELEKQGENYDVIVCSEVLEHLDQPGDLLKVIFQRLKEGGILIATVPNGMGPREVLITKPTLYLSQKNNGLWRGLNKIKSALGYSGTTVQSAADNLDHVQFFTRSSLTRLMRVNGFKLKRFGHANYMEDVFPFSMLTNRVKFFQRIDCTLADILPSPMVGGFFSVWSKDASLKNG